MKTFILIVCVLFSVAYAQMEGYGAGLGAAGGYEGENAGYSPEAYEGGEYAAAAGQGGYEEGGYGSPAAAASYEGDAGAGYESFDGAASSYQGGYAPEGGETHTAEAGYGGPSY